jgi:hypothetical protein
MSTDFLSSNSSSFYSFYLDKIDQSKHGNIYSDLFTTQSDKELTYRSIWQNLNYRNICPNTSQDASYNQELESVSVYQTIDLLSEGPVYGLCDKKGDVTELTNNTNQNEDVLKGVYLNDFPVKNSVADTFNFNRTFVDVRLGTADQNILTKFENNILNFFSRQTFEVNLDLTPLNKNNFSVFPSAFNLTTAKGSQITISKPPRTGVTWAFAGNYAEPLDRSSDGLSALRSAEKNQSVKFSHSVTNDNTVAINIDMSVILSANSSSGNVYGNSVNFVIKVGYEGDDLLLTEGGSVVYLYCSIHGIATSNYVRSYLLPLPPSIQGVDRQVQIYRIDRKNERSETKSVYTSSLSVKSISEIIIEDINYTNSCVVGSIFDARAFSQIPKRTFDFKLLKVRIPSNYDPETRFYNGDWDGSFKKELYWTDNPAWVLYDLLTNKRYGLGKYDFQRSFVDKWNLYEISKYCDDLVTTGETALVPPMLFSVNAGGTKVTIDDSSDKLGEEILLNRYPEGSTICLYDLKKSSDGTGDSINKGYKRIVYRPFYDQGTNKFSFTILQEPPITEIFETYPNLKNQYYTNTENYSKKDWIISKWLYSQNSQSPYISNYTSGLPLDSSVRSGLVVGESFSKSEILEPRFNCNLYFDKFQQAIDALNQVASLFRGLIYWANNYVFVSNDKERDAVLLFNNANVKDGLFNYSGSSKTARSTAALVRYNDKRDNFKAKAIYIEDIKGMREYGYLLKEITAIGVTSKTQAQRIGKWALYTEQTEQDIATFNTGAEGSILLPGDVIKIQDKLKTISRYGGRISSINYATKKITLDKGISDDLVGQKITVMVPKKIKSYRDLNLQAKIKLKDPDDTPITQLDINETRQTQIKEFTISSISQSNIISITEMSDQDFNLIPLGSLWSVQNASPEYNIKEIKYRILSVNEQNQNDYSVTAMMYNSTKFDAIDFQNELESNQDSKPQKVIISNFPEPISSDNPDINNLSVANSSYYDGYFTIKTSNNDKQLSVDFSGQSSGFNNLNTGGYIVEVYKDGEKIRFALDGYDNTSFVVFLGNGDLFKYLSYDIYRYDTDYKLESLNL